jgi:RimJ/RimL family protein N-acetyltransferase
MADQVAADRDAAWSLEAIPGADIVLRAFRDDDAAALVAAFADPDIQQWNPRLATDLIDMSDWIRDRNDRSNRSRISWAVGDSDGSLAGSISLHNIDLDSGDAECGYWVVPPARRRGIGVAALALATEFGFAHLGLRRLYLYHAVANVASCRVATTVGYRQEGQLRESYRYGDGAFHDEHLHARLATDPLLPRHLAAGARD